jgi:hypothetical protein
MKKIKTSLSLSHSALRAAKREAKRQRRSVSQILEMWIERIPNGNSVPSTEPIFSNETVKAGE